MHILTGLGLSDPTIMWDAALRTDSDDWWDSVCVREERVCVCGGGKECEFICV